MRTLLPEAGILSRDKYLHPTKYCGMQLLIPAWDTYMNENKSFFCCVKPTELFYLEEFSTVSKLSASILGMLTDMTEGYIQDDGSLNAAL